MKEPSLSALVQRLAVLQSLPVAPDLDAIEADFSDEFARFAQLEFRGDGRRIDLVGGTASPDVVDRWAARLRARGLGEADLADALALARSGRGRGFGFKLPVAGPLDGAELYIRGATPVDEASSWLRSRGCTAAVTDMLANVGDALLRDHAYMLAADVGPEARFSVIFTQYRAADGTCWPRLEEAMAAVGVGSEGRSTMRDLHRRLGVRRPRTLFCSVVCGRDTIEPAIKLDYSDVGLAAVLRIVGAHLDLAVLSRWRAVLRARRVDQVGLVYSAEHGLGLRAYFGCQRR